MCVPSQLVWAFVVGIMENKGWIKLHRKILDNPLLNKNNDWRIIWENLLLLATHDGMWKIFKGQKKYLKPGQLITGRNHLAEISNVHPSKIERALRRFENEQQIKQQTTTKNRLITILNWNEYQSPNIKTNNKRTTNEQQTNTYNNDKNVKNDKKRGKSKFSPPSLEEIQNRIQKKNYTYVDAESFYNFYTANGWKVGKNKMKDWKAALAGWESRKKQENKIKPTGKEY